MTGARRRRPLPTNVGTFPSGYNNSARTMRAASRAPRVCRTSASAWATSVPRWPRPGHDQRPGRGRRRGRRGPPRPRWARRPAGRRRALRDQGRRDLPGRQALGRSAGPGPPPRRSTPRPNRSAPSTPPPRRRPPDPATCPAACPWPAPHGHRRRTPLRIPSHRHGPPTVCPIARPARSGRADCVMRTGPRPEAVAASSPVAGDLPCTPTRPAQPSPLTSPGPAATAQRRLDLVPLPGPRRTLSSVRFFAGRLPARRVAPRLPAIP